MPKKPHAVCDETDDDDDDDGVYDHEAMTRRMFAVRRKLFTGLYFWFVCPRAICKRGRKCLGDTDLCRQRHLPMVPARTRAMISKIIAARNSGLSQEEAVRVVEEDMKRHDEALERMGQKWDD